MKNKKTKKKVKELRLKMKFNPGTMSYEPVLPENKRLKKDNIKIAWWIILFFIIFLTLFSYFIIKNIN